MELYKGFKSIAAKSRQDWRRWLEKNHDKQEFVWLIIYHKGCRKKSVYYAEAVEEALCFGWIDSKPNKRDGESFYLSFARRKPKSQWSRINRERVKRLIQANLMTDAGLAMVRLAKRTGTWTSLNVVEKGVIPPDLKKAFSRNAAAKKNFEAFPPSSKRIILNWIASAKRDETRRKRVVETIELAAKNIRANHYRP